MSCASPCDTGYPSSVRTTRGVTTKIDATAANESWNPASKSAYGFQPRSTAAPTSSACQRSRSRPASQAREPSPAASAARTTDGWSPTASAYAATVSERRELSDVDPEAEEQDDGRGATPDRGYLQPVDGEAVVEARGPEVCEQALVDAGAAPEDDRLDHVASLALQPRRRVAAEPASDAVADAGDAAAPADDPPRLPLQDRVDALPAQPRRLVEAVRRPRRSPQLAQEPEPGSLRRRSPERKLEQDRLVERSVPQRRTSAFIRWSKLPASAAPPPRRPPTRRCRFATRATLWSSCASRMLPQPQAPATTARGDHRQSEARLGCREPERGENRRPGRESERAACARGSTSAKPRQSAPTSACGGRTVTSRDHQSLQLGHVRGPDPRHALQLGDRVERPVLLAVVEDLLRRDRPDSRQVLELLERRGVQVERRGRRRARRGRGRRDDAGRTASRHDDLLAVGDGSGEIDRAELRLGASPRRRPRSRRRSSSPTRSR